MISIVIPAYEMHGRGAEFLARLLFSIRLVPDSCEVVVSDTGGLRDTAREFNAVYVEGKEGAAANLNNAIDHATGDIIKPMFQDDMFRSLNILGRLEGAFDAGAEWVACRSYNKAENESSTFTPYPHVSVERLREGENTYGSPSAMAWRKNDLRFDEKLQWLFDCEFYARMAERYGVPAFIDSKVCITQWEGQATHTVVNGSVRVLDHNYVVEKYRDFGGMEH